MYELIQAGENTFYMDCPAKVGFFRTDENHVVMIDSGSDKDAAKKAGKILDAQGWTLTAIYNTHSHADHIGGNQYLQNKTGCRIFAPETEHSFTVNTILEPVMLYGSFALEELKNKFLMAKESAAEILHEGDLPEGMSLISLPGHSYNMVGFRTADDVVFLADSLASVATTEKYKIGFLYDVEAFINTLEYIKTLEAKCFVPAHAEAAADIKELAQYNIDKTLEICKTIKGYLETPLCFEELLAKIFSGYELSMNLQQRVLVGSTVKAYLAYLKNKGQLDYSFENNMMLWKCRQETE